MLIIQYTQVTDDKKGSGICTGIPAHDRTAHTGLPQKTARGSLLNRPSCPFDDPNDKEIELNVSIEHHDTLLHIQIGSD